MRIVREDPQQVRLDLRVVTPDGPRPQAARERAETLGAIKRAERIGHYVFVDPAGHPFCL